MTQPVPATATPRAAALRAYLAGLVAAVVLALVPVLQASLGSVQWSTAGLEAVAVALLGPALTAAAAYVAHVRYGPPV